MPKPCESDPLALDYELCKYIMLYSYLLWASAVTLLTPQSAALVIPTKNCGGFVNTPRIRVDALSSTSSGQAQDDYPSPISSSIELSRGKWLSNAFSMTTASLLAGLIISTPSIASADDGDASSVTSYSITKCPTNSKVPCVSTANVRNLDLYLPPWTFTTTPQEAMASLKGAIVSDSSCEIVQQDGSARLLVKAKRGGAADVFGGNIDDLEFIMNANDQVVTFRSSASNENSDFGINKRRLEEIRKRAGIFGIMGESLNSADSFTDDQKGYGAFGQLKAFYGYQSGAGYEDVLREK